MAVDVGGLLRKAPPRPPNLFKLLYIGATWYRYTMGVISHLKKRTNESILRSMKQRFPDCDCVANVSTTKVQI